MEKGLYALSSLTGTMKIFIDTADLDEIREACSWGIVDGVTTNPSLIKKAVAKHGDIDMEAYIQEICSTVDGPVSLEVKGVTADDVIMEAETLYDLFNPVNDNVVVKVPVNTAMQDGDSNVEGLQAIRQLAEEDIPTNATLVMTSEQALMAAKAGATYASPFLGRIDDYIRKQLGVDFDKGDYHDAWLLQTIEEHTATEAWNGDPEELYTSIRGSGLHDNGIYSGVELTASIIAIYAAYAFDTEIIAASIRNARQAREVAEMGVDIATLPFTVIEEMLTHYKSMEGMQRFVDDVVPEYEALFR